MTEQEERIRFIGKDAAEKLVESQYPSLVERDTGVILARARSIIKNKMDEAQGKPYSQYGNPFSLDGTVHPRAQNEYRERYEAVYINTFVKAYFDKLAALDKKAGITPPIPTAPSPTGATIRVTNIDRSNPDKYVYHVELVDPGYIDGVFQPEPLTVVFEPEAPTASSGSSFGGLASSFSDTARASASSDAIPSRTTQSGRKPIRSQWGKQ